MDQDTSVTTEPTFKLCKLYLDLLTLLYLGNNQDKLTILQQRVNIHCAWLKSTLPLFRNFLNIGPHFWQLSRFLSKYTGRYHLATFQKDLSKLTRYIENYPDTTPDQHLQAATEAYSFACTELRISNQVHADYYSVVSRYTNQRQGVPGLKLAINTPRWHKATGTAYHSRPQPVQPSPIPTRNRFTVLDYLTPKQTSGLQNNKSTLPEQTTKTSQNSQKPVNQPQNPASKNHATNFQTKKRGSSPTLLPNSSPMKKARKQILTELPPAPATSTASDDLDLKTKPASTSNNSIEEQLEGDTEGFVLELDNSLDDTIEMDCEQPSPEASTSNTPPPPTAETNQPEDSTRMPTSNISTFLPVPDTQLHPEIRYTQNKAKDWTIPASTASTYIIGDQDVSGLQLKPTSDTQVLSYNRSSFLDLANLLKNCSVRVQVKHVLISITVARHPHTPAKTMAKQISSLLKHSKKTFPNGIIWLPSSNVLSEFLQNNDSKECELISLLRRSKKQNSDLFGQLKFISTLPLTVHSKLTSKSSGKELYKSIKIALGQHWLCQMHFLDQNPANITFP